LLRSNFYLLNRPEAQFPLTVPPIELHSLAV
jgi:hypothetical protein